ncbi:MAG: hypothetical protein N2512_08940 [Armatimonadetes bacterium]|nr:hypothetical protein [Armatimonadota bacterium]
MLDPLFERILVWWPDWAFALFCSVLVSALGTSLYQVLDLLGLSPVPVEENEAKDRSALERLLRELEESHRGLARKLTGFARRHGGDRKSLWRSILPGRRADRRTPGTTTSSLSTQISLGLQLLLDMLSSAPTAHLYSSSRRFLGVIKRLADSGLLDAAQAEEWRTLVKEKLKEQDGRLTNDVWTLGAWGKGKQTLQALFAAVADELEKLASGASEPATAPTGPSVNAQPTTTQPEETPFTRGPELREKVKRLREHLEQLNTQAQRVAKDEAPRAA